MCVRFARESGVPIALRSGGHSYTGASTGEGLVVDVSGIDEVAVGDGTVTVGAGARLIDIYDRLSSHGLGIGAGSCPTVGIAGLTLGGGIGVLSRAWGLTCDQLVSADVVTADGTLRSCDATTEPDLFWAIRGGGGSFGVATSLTFATRRAVSLALGTQIWEWASAAAVFAAWQHQMDGSPAEHWSTLHLEGGSAERSVLTHEVAFGDVAGLASWSDELGRRAHRSPAYRESAQRSYRDVMLLEAGCLGRPVTECHVRGATPQGTLERETYAAKSIVADRPVSDEVIDTLVARVGEAASFGAAVLIDPLGGAIARVDPAATPFPHRSAFAVVQLLASWPGGVSGDAATQWLRQTYAMVRPLIGRGAYANYADADLSDWPSAYYGANYARLRAVKRTYDPDRLFDFPQAIVPADA